jgi:hypothetical protein
MAVKAGKRGARPALKSIAPSIITTRHSKGLEHNVRKTCNSLGNSCRGPVSCQAVLDNFQKGPGKGPTMRAGMLGV